MPRRKKTRTTSTEEPPGRGGRRLNTIRRQVAAEAARIMATEGQHNFLAAKHKAAERLGIRSRAGLPSNVEVEEALRAYQSLYGGEGHARHLRALREAAIAAMRFLEPFSPRLVGPVLEGTADRHSRVALHVFSDPPEEVELHLQHNRLPYRQEQRRIRWHDGQHRDVHVLVTEAGEVTVEMALFRDLDLRQPPPSPVDGRPQRRAPVGEVESLLDECGAPLGAALGF